MRTGGKWSIKDRGKFFTPLAWQKTEHNILEREGVEDRNLLLAVNEAPKAADPTLARLVKRHNVLLDSGVYSLAMDTAKAEGMSHDEALQLHPSRIKNYDKNMEKYRSLLDAFKKELWGYVEVDYGGREMKKAVRAELEEDGYRPIPVFHAAIDGWDYFRELDEKYDRICLGSMVKASSKQRFEYLARAAKERKNCKWIHALGVTPTATWISCPTESSDSTGYKFNFMFGGPAPGLAGWRQLRDLSLDYGDCDIDALLYACLEEAAIWSDQVKHRMRDEPVLHQS